MGLWSATKSSGHGLHTTRDNESNESCVHVACTGCYHAVQRYARQNTAFGFTSGSHQVGAHRHGPLGRGNDVCLCRRHHGSRTRKLVLSWNAYALLYQESVDISIAPKEQRKAVQMLLRRSRKSSVCVGAGWISNGGGGDTGCDYVEVMPIIQPPGFLAP
jgi:hypothetical protein